MTDKLNLTVNFDEMDKFIRERIDRGIEENRKGIASLEFVNKEGNPVDGVEVEVRQTEHDFQFGCNIFMLDGYDSESENEKYKEHFKELFNLAIAPFYWGPLEPEQGRVRFAKDSEHIFRRPAPDLVLDFCEKNDIGVKGHNLLWQILYPDWLPDDKEEVKPYIIKRFREIAERYRDRIQAWDVVNEPLTRYRHPEAILPDDYVYWCFELAERYFPHNTLILNEVTSPWYNYNYEYSHYYLLIENLLLRGARIDEIGLQYHLFIDKKGLREKRDIILNPGQLFKILDLYSDFKLPIHISEITIPGYSNDSKDEENQKVLVENLYKLWFSQPQVKAIVWWNLHDGPAWKDEGELKGGLLREDFSKKPAYQILDELINNQWMTDVKLSGSSQYKFKGFYGNYDLNIKYKGEEIKKEIHLSDTSLNEFKIEI